MASVQWRGTGDIFPSWCQTRRKEICKEKKRNLDENLCHGRHDIGKNVFRSSYKMSLFLGRMLAKSDQCIECAL